MTLPGNPASRSRLGRASALFDWATETVIGRMVGLGLLLGLLFFCISGWEWLHTHGHPVEHATLIKSVSTGEDESCGKAGRSEIRRETWVSHDPPRGLPEVFTREAGCEAGSVGDDDIVVRVPHDDGRVDVWVEPAATAGDVAFFSGMGFVAGALISLVGLMLQLAWAGIADGVRRLSGRTRPARSARHRRM